MKIRVYAAMLLGALLLAGCGAAGDESPQPPGGGGGSTNPFGGRLIAEGTAKVHDIDLSGNGSWTERLSDTVYGTVGLHLPANELAIASTSYGAPLTVEFYDLDNFALKDTFVWPDSTEMSHGRVDSIAVSTDGQHLAAVLSGGSTPFLEVVNRQTKEVQFSGGLGMRGTDMLWLPGDWLVFVAELTGSSFAGGIVAVSLEELVAESDTIDLGIFVGFSADQWAVALPFDFVFSHDGSELAYAWNGDIWVNNLDGQLSHQLTRGPTTLVGPVFSPDGSNIAFVEAQRYSLRDTFVMPNHRGEPLFVSSMNRPDTQAYLLEARTLVDTMLVWQD